MDNWAHYYNIAASRPELKEFKNFLQIHYNKPHINMGENKISYEVKKEIQTEEGPKIVKETITKRINQLLKELAPKNDSEGNNI